MEFNKVIVLSGFLLLLLSCSSRNHKTNLVVEKSDLHLNSTEGLYFYKKSPFSGIAVRYFKSGEIKERIEYLKGKKHGIFEKFHSNQIKSYKAHYKLGKLDGISKSWWPNGHLRDSNFYQNGLLKGKAVSYYKTGEKFKELNFVEGLESGIQKAWRKNGKLYCNYEVKNGRAYGLKKANLCFSINDSEIQY